MTATTLSSEARAAGVSGFYVRNAWTKIVVRGPFDSSADAQRVADEEMVAKWEVTGR